MEFESGNRGKQKSFAGGCYPQ